MQSQLKDAEENLKDSEYERFISDSKDILNNLYDEYAKLVNDVMNDHDKLLKEALDLFAQTGADVQDVIRAVADEYNYEITGEMEKIISSIEGMGSLDTYLGVGGTITQSLGDIVNEVHNAYVGLSSDMQGMKDAVASIGYQGKYDTSDVDNTDNYIHDNTDIGNSSNTSTGSNSDTSAGKNDNVNKASDFKTLMDMGSYIDKMMKMPEVQSRPQETNVKVEYDNVNINLPNVMNYEDFMYKAQKDHKFEKMINYMVANQMGFGSRFEKKINRNWQMRIDD